MDRKYHDMDGNEKTLEQMVKCEPEWAVYRIKKSEEEIEENKKLREALELCLEALDTGRFTDKYIYYAKKILKETSDV